MSDSAFWRRLADKFRALPREYAAILHAEKYVVLGETEKAKWRLSGHVGPKAEFEALARRGARRFPKTPVATDLLNLWIETLFQKVPDSKDQGFFGTNIFDYQAEGVRKSINSIMYNLPRRSADYCKVMEAESVQREFDDSLVVKHVLVSAVPDPLAPLTTAGQIQKLRLECNWTIEVLARKTGFDEKTVKRHLSGNAMPRLGNLAIYQQAFSKVLNRQILIDKTPPKRPLNVR